MTLPNTAPTALILGGTRGLGLALAVESLARGIRPIIVGRTATAAKIAAQAAAVAEELRMRTLPVNERPEKKPDLTDAHYITCDITNTAEHRNIFDALRECSRPNSMNPAPQPRYVFWTVGMFHRGRLAEMSSVEQDRLTATMLTGPVAFLREFHKSRVMSPEKEMYHLVTVGSVLAFNTPHKPQALFSALQAAKVQFARTFAHELSRELAGSCNLVVNPWAMKTSFFSTTDIKTEKFMDPAEVAKIIHDRLFKSLEISLFRAEDGSIEVREGAQQPTL